MISKENFVKYLNRLRDVEDYRRERYFAGVEAYKRGVFDEIPNDEFIISHEDIVVNLLEDMFHDKGEDISYFIYELDYGRKYEPGMITDQNGNDIDFSTAEKLYDYLILQMEEDNA